MDLLIVGDVVLGEDTLDLLEVPVGDAGHLINLFRSLPKVSILAVRPIDTESEAVIVAGPNLNVILPVIIGFLFMMVLVVMIVSSYGATVEGLLLERFVFARFHVHWSWATASVSTLETRLLLLTVA